MSRLFILLLLALLAGCGQDKPAPRPAATPDPAKLPAEVSGDPGSALPRQPPRRP